MTKYVLFISQGGFNDSLYNISKTLAYCKKYNRTLLLDMMNTIYKINFSDFFDINDPCIIYDFNIIKNIISHNNFTVFPKNLENHLINVLHDEIRFKYEINKPYSYNDELLFLPDKIVNEDIIVHSRCGGGDTFNFFKNISLKNNVKNFCKKRLALLKDNKYLCIHVRYTDLKCDFKKLYNKNKQLIHSYKKIYVATDNKLVVNFFKSKKLNVFCFTTFPESKDYRNLHYYDIDPTVKMNDLLADIFIATNSSKILSNSKGNFINLMRKCFSNKKIILKKLE